MPPLAATLGPSAYWYLARGTGAVSLILLTASVVLGIMGPLRVSLRRWPRFTIDMLHRQISLLVLVFLVLHIVTSVLDGFAPITLLDGVIPFRSPYRPLWLGLGAVAFDLLIALVVTSLVRRRVGFRAWRAIHWLAYASWPVAVLHGLGTGSDTKQTWMQAVTIACGAAVVAAVVVRLAREPRIRGRALQPALLALSVLSPLGIVYFTIQGPLAKGWSKRAGTPASLLVAHVAPATATRAPLSASRGAAAAGAGAARLAPFSATLRGKLVQHTVSGGVIIDLSLRMAGSVPGRLRVRLAGAPLDGGGLSLTGSQVDLGAASTGVLAGQVRALQGTQFIARVSDAAGHALELRANLNIDNASGLVTGALAATPV